jgi:isoleucyl-tRNA synthetase
LTVILEEVNAKKATVAENLLGEDIGGVKVSLDFTLTPELVAEGQVREFIRAVQDLRKSSNLKPGELANLTVQASAEAQMLFEKNATEIKKTTSLSNLTICPLTGGADFSDENISYSLSLEI